MKVVLSHLTGNANVKAAAYGLAKAGLLAEFHVSLAAFPGSFLYKAGSIAAFSEIRRRGFDKILQPYTSMWPWLEMGRMMLPKLGLARLTNNESAPFYIDAVCKNLDRHVASKLPQAAKKGATAVYCYEDVAADSFKKAKSLGIKCIYDLPIGYWRTANKLLQIEQDRWPEWASTIIGFNNSEAKLARKDEELRLADMVIVASTFTASTLNDFPGKLPPVKIIPYGFPPVQTGKREYTVKNTNSKLKLLFVGSLSQRKGIANLFAVVNNLKGHVDLTLVGTKADDDCTALNNELVKHRWIPSLAHDKILNLMREHDVLIFPSLFEGFGLVITEAMSQGTPVITTDRTAGPDVIKSGENGWLVKAGSVEALQEAVERLLNNPNYIATAGREAMETARKRPWEVYGRELALAVRHC